MAEGGRRLVSERRRANGRIEEGLVVRGGVPGNGSSSGPARASIGEQLVDRAVGSLLAAACGDALGWPVEPRGSRVGGTRDLKPALEFIEWRRREGGRYGAWERRIPPGTYSDDTQLLLCVARSLLSGDDWWERFVRVELPMWTIYELGGGGAVRRAAQTWAKGTPPWSESLKESDRRKHFDAGGNGVVMRIAPHAIWGASDRDFGAVAERILADGVVTHGHPRALVGALCAGYATWRALRFRGRLAYGELVEDALAGVEEWGPIPAFVGASSEFADRALAETGGGWPAIWEQTVEEMLGLLSSCREAIGRGTLARDSEVLDELGVLGPEGGAGTRTAAAALYFASRYITRPPAGLLAAAFARKTDTDTNACVTGALLGAFEGEDWVRPLASGLQDADYIAAVAAALATHEQLRVRTEEWDPRLKRSLNAQLDTADADVMIELPVFGSARVRSREEAETKTNKITAWWLETQLGQMITTTKTTKLKPGEAGVTDQVATPSAPAERRGTAVELPRSEQLSITPAHEPEPGEGAQPKSGPRVWTAVTVRDLKRSRALYHGQLGLAIRRESSEFIFFQSNLLLEQDPQPAPEYRALPRGGRRFDAPARITVLLERESFAALYERLTRSTLVVSTVLKLSEGDRFRLLDFDENVIEVRATSGD